jgi:hypothetical protein
VGSGNVQSASQIPPAIGNLLRIAGPGSREDCAPYRINVNLASTGDLETHEQSGRPGNNRRGVAGTRPNSDTVAVAGTNHIFTRGEHATLLIGFTPVAELHRLRLAVHCPNGEHGGQSTGEVKAITALVSGSGDNEGASVTAYFLLRDFAHNVGENRMRRARRGKLATADIDNVCAVLHRKSDGSSKINLRA